LRTSKTREERDQLIEKKRNTGELVKESGKQSTSINYDQGGAKIRRVEREGETWAGAGGHRLEGTGA